ncbi:MAG TPA: O-antigen ligase family protein [Oligoflexus sp.]|uniref:O-antigen ligase family protein n=1 Tax=Oligoflexus sp. TaxID=1971216 RepID=UPI002D7F6F7B|nr:O-antigen ligase family protein [Oligoflexus sp.]HET9238529.1 O-antigen ligase family protein [Oligoflexus sp.]
MQGSDDGSSRATLIVLVLLFCVFPFGPAFQSLGQALVFLSALYLGRARLVSSFQTMPRDVRWLLGGMAAFLLWNVFATLISPSQHHAEPGSYFVGYAPLFILPWLTGLLPKLDDAQKKKLLSFAAGLVLIWGLAVFSQYLFPWRLSGLSLVEHTTRRAQGFYSHPMSLAYASLLIWPFAVRLLLKSPRLWQSWCFAAGAAMLLLFSMSRIVQLLAALVVLGNVFIMLSGRQRLLALMASLLIGTGLAVTDNPVSARFHNLLHPTAQDVMSDYPDDRLAFWHAHLLIIQERPWLGHGVHQGNAFRKPYYERLGLGDFKKQYQAHNQYIQIVAEGGLIALALYGFWLVMTWRVLKRWIGDAFIRNTGQQTLLIFSLGVLTQNAFDDTCVRMGVVILFCVLFLNLPAWTHKPERAA